MVSSNLTTRSGLRMPGAPGIACMVNEYCPLVSVGSFVQMFQDGAGGTCIQHVSQRFWGLTTLRHVVSVVTLEQCSTDLVGSRLHLPFIANR